MRNDHFQSNRAQRNLQWANIREAQYAHGMADFIAKLQIALKEANETGYWLELLYKTGYLTEENFKALDSACASIRVLLISSLNTAKKNGKALWPL